MSGGFVRTFVAAFVLSVWGCGSSDPIDAGVVPSDVGFRDSGTTMMAEAQIGPTGGSLSLGPVSLLVGAGAVSQATTFRISESDRSPSLPAGSSAISKVYRFEPAQTFAEPVRVTITVDRSRVPARVGATDGLLLLRAPTGTNSFEAIGAAELGATEVIADLPGFSEIVLAVFTLANCALPDPQNCNATCDRLNPNQCAGSCQLGTPGGTYTASCNYNQATLQIDCTCGSTDPSRNPVQSGTLNLFTLLLGGAGPLTAHTFLSRCGWPCAEPAPTDAGFSDAGPDGGTPDTGMDAGVDAGMDAGSLDASDVGPVTVEPLATNVFFSYPDWLALNGDELFVNGGGLTTVNLTTLSGAQRAAGTGPVDGAWGSSIIDADATDVWVGAYDTADGDPLKVNQLPRAGGAPVERADGVFLCTSATHVFFAAVTGTPGVYSMPKAGGTPTFLSNLPPNGPSPCVVDGTHLYTLGITPTLGEVFKIPLAGGGFQSLAFGAGGPGVLLLDGNTLYWANNPVGNIVIVDKASGAVTLWTEGHFGIRQITQDADFVYWSRTELDSTRTVLKKAKLGNPSPIPLLSNHVSDEIWGLAVDAQYLYFSTSNSPGGVFRILK